MTTIINAGTTTATALSITTDTSGSLAIQTSGANAISISSSQVVTLANPLLPASGGTGITSLGTGVATFLGTPSSANLAAALTDETGTGVAVFSESPTFTGTPLAPTAAPGTSTTQIATTAFVQNVTSTLGTMSTQNANAVAITGGTVSGITDLAVADGGTGASTFTANSVVLGNGTSALNGNLVAPSTAGKVLVSNGTTWTAQTIAASGIKLGLGITGEIWNDLTGSRSSGTVYQNTNAYPIQVSVWQNSQYNSNAYFYVGATAGTVAQIAAWGAQFNGAGAISGIAGPIVPAGYYYQVNTNSGGVSGWWELY